MSGNIFFGWPNGGRFLFAGGDERRKDSAMGLVFWRKRLGMPLHAQGKTMACALDSFDDAVIGNRVDDQSSAELFHGLMMAGINLYTVASKNHGETCVRDDFDVMAAVEFFLALFVF